MHQNGKRHCDICGEIIPQGAIYQIRSLDPGASQTLMTAGDTEMVPTWTAQEDGSVRLDICTYCSLAMGRTSVPSNKIH